MIPRAAGRSTVLASIAALTALAALAGPAPAEAKRCGRFIIGEANSTSYPGMRLPAHGSASGARCSTLRRIARRLHDGTYKMPESASASAQYPSYGRPFRIRDRGRRWTCRFQNRGGSGPYYAMRCRRPSSRVRWVTGS